MIVSVKSPLPGKLIKYQIKEGDKVSKGDTLLVIESMKMFNEILSEEDGVVIKLTSSPNEYVAVNSELLQVEKS